MIGLNTSLLMTICPRRLILNDVTLQTAPRSWSSKYYKPPCIGLHKLRYLHVHEVKKQHREMVISSPVLIGLSILIFHGSWILSDPAHITLAFGRSEWLKQDSSVLSLELNPFVSQIFNIWRICSAFTSSCSMKLKLKLLELVLRLVFLSWYSRVWISGRLP